jgi:hypothetical protein
MIVCFFTISSTSFQNQTGKISSPGVIEKPNLNQVKIQEDYGKMPLYFIPNQGQMNQQVFYYVQGKDKTIYFTSGGLTYSFNAPRLTSQRWVVKMEFVGASENVKPECLEQGETIVSYFHGKPGQWHAGLQSASKIIYRELWPGIDLIYSGTINKMKYEFIIHPGADPSQVKLAYHGIKSMAENNLGQLEVKTPGGTFTDDTPAAWQEIDGKRENVTIKYAVADKTENTPATFGFSIGKYNPRQALILDPAVIVYCGYIGSSNEDQGCGITVDSSGCAYVVGKVYSDQANFPVQVGPDVIHNGAFDVFVAKVKADGTGLVYCGYIGGDVNDYCQAIAVDASGCAYIAGETDSSDATFPVTVGPDLTYNGGSKDIFVAKIKANGTSLDYCGYIGGASIDIGYGIALDTQGCAYISGYTGSTHASFPVKIGPDLIYNSGYEAFIAKVKADGTELVYCGYIGGSLDDKGSGVAVDSSGCAYISGWTNSTQSSFPVTVGPDLTYNSGSFDAFVAKVKADGTGLDYCGYIGGSDYDYGRAIAVDSSGSAYVAGQTNSDHNSFPVIVGPDLTYNPASWNAFVAKVNSAGTGLSYCGYIVASEDYFGPAIAVDGASCAYVACHTQGTEFWFPVTVGPDLTHNGMVDGYVAKLNATGSGYDYCGYIGGAECDYAYGIAVDKYGCAYVTGATSSPGATFPVTIGPDLTYNDTYSFDAFVAKISGNPVYTVNFAAGNGGSLTGITTQSVVQGNSCSAVTAVPNNGYNFVNWTGTNGFVTTTDNPLTVSNVNADMMITANFVHANPAGWIPLDEFQNNMIVYGKAYNGNNPAIEGDWLGAFGPGGISDCRGIAAVQANGNYYITVGSNATFGETITFKIWPIPSGPAVDGSESIAFIDNEIYDGVPLHFGPRNQNIALVNGWNWVSFNTLPVDTSFNAVFGNPGAFEQIKSQNQAAIYSGGTWIGDLTNMNGIANGIMYKVKTNQAYSFSITGMTVSFNTALSLVIGWNWTAYLPTLKQPVADAVTSIITPVSQIKSQTQSVVKIGSTLLGDLVEMQPNKGYTIAMNQAGVLEYPHGVSTFPDQRNGKAKSTSAANVSWPVIKGNQYNMIAAGKVYFEGKIINTTGYYLGSIGPRGENDGRSFSPVKTDGSYFATILGNAGGETVKFKLINSANGKTYDVAGSLEFQPDNLKTGFDLKARSVRVTTPTEGTIMRMGSTCTISWNAYEVNNVKIELYKGGKSLLVIAPSIPAGFQTYNWTIPDRMVAGSDFKIKVSAIDTGVIAGDSSRAFTIKPVPAVTLSSPNGGESYQVTKSYDITWRSSDIANVKIELYKGTILQKVISASTPAAVVKYTWEIPANYPQGTKFKIKITGLDTGLNVNDASDNYFSITGNTAAISDSKRHPD